MWFPYGVGPHDFKIDKSKTKPVRAGGFFDPKCLRERGPWNSAPHEVKLVDGKWQAVPVESPRRPTVVSPSVAPDQRPAGVKKPQMSQSAPERKFGT